MLIVSRLACRYKVRPVTDAKSGRKREPSDMSSLASTPFSHIHRPSLNRRSIAIASAIAASAFLVLSGCSSHRTIEDEVFAAHRNVHDALFARTFTTDEPIELKTTGAVAVDIDNFAGDVVIRADRNVTRTFVEVRRVSTHGLGRWMESYDALDDARWTATLEPRIGGGETLVIRTDTPNIEEHFHHVEILVVTPALDTARVRTTNGDVTVIENQGAVDIETTRGNVRMMTPWPMTNPMSIITSEGSIDYRVRGESKGAFDCESHGGQVRQRCEYGHWLALDTDNDHDRFYAVLNGGTNPVVLRTSDENIRVAVVPNPTAVGPIISDP